MIEATLALLRALDNTDFQDDHIQNLKMAILGHPDLVERALECFCDGTNELERYEFSGLHQVFDDLEQMFMRHVFITIPEFTLYLADRYSWIPTDSHETLLVERVRKYAYEQLCSVWEIDSPKPSTDFVVVKNDDLDARLASIRLSIQQGDTAHALSLIDKIIKDGGQR